MLYLSTKNKADSFTAYRVLHSNAAPDGGMFMPMHIPYQDDIALAAFEQMSFGESTATILNLFFGTKLTAWDVECAVGRQALALVSAGYKVSLLESWHNPAGTHEYLISKLYQLATAELIHKEEPNLWFRTVVDIALLFAAYGKFCRQEIYTFDVAIETGDLQQLLAVRYARKMGLPVRKIILGCMEGDGIWEFLSYGTYLARHSDAVVCFEALLWLEFSYDSIERTGEASKRKAHYRLNDACLEQFRKGLFATVVGDSRVRNVVESTMQTNQYLMVSSTARAFGALQDYRAKTGENKNTLLFARSIPVK